MAGSSEDGSSAEDVDDSNMAKQTDDEDADEDTDTSLSDVGPSLIERRAVNIRRNAAMAERLSLEYGITQKEPPKKEEKSLQEPWEIQHLP